MNRQNPSEDPAWIDWRERFAELYDQSNYESPLQKWVMRSSHALVEKPFGESAFFERVLEIGAGTGEHLPFVRHRFSTYIMSDSNQKALDVAKRKLPGAKNEQVLFEVEEGGGLSYPDDSFDRVVAVHVLEHINKPHLALKEWRRVVKPGGMLSILIPTDPGVAWRIGRCLGPRRNAIAKGIAYDYVMAREHVNPCNNLVALVRHYFSNAVEAWWPLRVPSMDLNLFCAFHAVVHKQGSRQ